MNRLTTALRNAAIDGIIKLPVALSIAREFDEDEETSVNLLTQCKTQVGMMLGEDLRVHEAKLKGTQFSVRDFHAERLPGEQ